MSHNLSSLVFDGVMSGFVLLTLLPAPSSSVSDKKSHEADDVICAPRRRWQRQPEVRKWMEETWKNDEMTNVPSSDVHCS